MSIMRSTGKSGRSKVPYEFHITAPTCPVAFFHLIDHRDGDCGLVFESA